MSATAPTLLNAARRALAAGDFTGAEGQLLEALKLDPRGVPLWLNLAAARRQLGNSAGAFQALREALKIEPRNFHGLLMQASLLERDGDSKEAAIAYGRALAHAPPKQYLDAATQHAMQHAQEVHDRYTRETRDFVQARLADASIQYAAGVRRRVEAFVDMTLRIRPRYQQQPMEYYYPELPPIEFYDRAEFPWLEEFEGATSEIQRELTTILRDDERSFEPYIHYDDHLPLDQWRELNHSPRWSAFHFYERGEPIEERCQRAPATVAAISKLPLARVPKRSPAALYSVLQPNTRIPPHTGVANFRLVVHLPLIVPSGCAFRVGGQTREWRIGEAWVFDDTIEHEAWNDSDRVRVILICDVWNPRLSQEERSMIAHVIAALDAFNGEPTSTPQI